LLSPKVLLPDAATTGTWRASRSIRRFYEVKDDPFGKIHDIHQYLKSAHTIITIKNVV